MKTLRTVRRLVDDCVIQDKVEAEVCKQLAAWPPVPMLRELCLACGWQGGTIWQVIEEIKRLKAVNQTLVAALDKISSGEWGQAGQRHIAAGVLREAFLKAEDDLK